MYVPEYRESEGWGGSCLQHRDGWEPSSISLVLSLDLKDDLLVLFSVTLSSHALLQIPYQILPGEKD